MFQRRLLTWCAEPYPRAAVFAGPQLGVRCSRATFAAIGGRDELTFGEDAKPDDK